MFLRESMCISRLYFNESYTGLMQDGTIEKPLAQIDKLYNYLDNPFELVLQSNITCNSLFKITNNLIFEYE